MTAALIDATEAFIQDKRGMSRMDCLTIQLMLVVLLGSGLYVAKDSGDRWGGTRIGEEKTVATALAETGPEFLGLPIPDIVLWLMCAAAVIFIIRLVVEARR